MWRDMLKFNVKYMCGFSIQNFYEKSFLNIYIFPRSLIKCKSNCDISNGYTERSDLLSFT